jgi:hypothetical protein
MQLFSSLFLLSACYAQISFSVEEINLITASTVKIVQKTAAEKIKTNTV